MMDPKMDDKMLKLQSLMELIKEMKMEDSKSLPGKPKVTEIEIHAAKLPGKPMEGAAHMGMEPSMEDESHEPMDMTDEGAEHEDNESPEQEEAEGEGQEELLSKLPPQLQELLKEHLRKKM